MALVLPACVQAHTHAHTHARTHTHFNLLQLGSPVALFPKGQAFRRQLPAASGSPSLSSLV